MRIAVVGFFLLVAGFASARPAEAQLDEKPPVIQRNDPANPNPFPNPSAQRESKDGPKDSAKEPAGTVHGSGIVRRIDSKAIQVEAEDTRMLVCTITSATDITGPSGKMSIEDIEPGMHVKVQAKPTADGEELTAVTISIDNPVAKPEHEKTATIQNSADDEDRPVLRRGIPAKSKKKDDDSEETIASLDKPASAARATAAPKPPADDDDTPVKAPGRPLLIDTARDANEEFTSKLPNFVCQQFTTRYERESKVSGWDAKDVVSATVVYIDGKEDYQNIKVGNRAVKQDMMEIKGQRSVGEFGSVLHSLLARASAADFRYVKDEEVKHQRAKVYDFIVKRSASDWQILLGGQSIIPGYSGRVWIAKENGRVLRIERQADAIPEEFPIDTAEQTIDYDFVTISDRKVLLPTQSENLSCQRGSSFCSKNVIEFRNYRQFRGEATIQFEK